MIVTRPVDLANRIRDELPAEMHVSVPLEFSASSNARMLVTLLSGEKFFVEVSRK